MKNLYLLTLLFMLSLGICQAQTTINSIREHYKFYKQQIENCSDGKENCSLYVNSLVINEQEKPWRGSGNFKKTVRFWYDDSPLHCDECGENGISTLTFVSTSSEIGLTNSYEEWLFKKGSLIFYYHKETGEYPSEIRYYYMDGALIRFIGDGEQLDGERALTKDKPSIITRAQALQQTFLLSFN